MAPPGINHPYFTRISNTLYILHVPDAGYKKLLHVGQIMAYLSFDQYIRKHGGAKISLFPGIPIGFLDFALAFNSGKCSSDLREVSVCVIDDQGKEITPATGSSLSLVDFRIRPEQCSFPPPRPKDAIPKEYTAIIEQFTIQTAMDNKCKKEFFDKREAKRQRMFKRPRKDKKLEDSFNLIDAVTTGFDISSSEASSSSLHEHESTYPSHELESPFIADTFLTMQG